LERKFHKKIEDKSKNFEAFQKKKIKFLKTMVKRKRQESLGELE
jgi:hypothetical protein